MQPSPETARGRLVVVIDDDPLVLDGMRGLLRSWGYRVVAVDSERAAFADLAGEDRPPDLIICDFHLAAGKTGLEAIEGLRHVFPVPACLISGETAPERLREINACGYELLHKPVQPAVLRLLVNRLLESGGVALSMGVPAIRA
jgi:two-component system, sensor histidine kinase